MCATILYAAVMYRYKYDYEIIPANEVPKLMLPW